MRRTLIVAVFALVAVAPQVGTAATITVFSNNLAGWQAAAGGPVVIETFSAGPPLATGMTIVSGNGTVSGGEYHDIVDNPVGSANDQVTFGFPFPISAFGANFDLSPGGSGQGIRIDVTFAGGGTQTVSVEVPSGFTGQFFGFVSDTPISQVQLRGGTQGGVQETFDMDNARFVAAATVPEPSTFALFGLIAGLGLGGYALRRRRLAAVA